MDKQNDIKWHCYRGFLIPNTAPHQNVDITSISDKSLWKSKRAFAARWTSCFDFGKETDWWYVIKDTPFDIQAIKAKRRYEINKGIKNFEVRIINPQEFKDELYEVFQKSLIGYPKAYRPKDNKDGFNKFLDGISRNSSVQILYGAFLKENEKLCGYIHIPTYTEWAALSSMKTDPQYERKGLNAAIIYQILLDYNERLSDGFYISDGQRTISHKTNFQDYLEKYFLFRRAYCKVNVKYSLLLKLIITALYPFRHIFYKLDFIKIFHEFNSLLRMEDSAKKCKSI